MNHHNQQTSKEISEQTVADLVRSAANRPVESPRNLNKDHGKSAYRDQLAKEPLVKKETHGGNVEQGLTHLIIAGQTVLGVSRDVNMKKVAANSYPVERVRVSVLPFGEAAGDLGSSRTLLDVKPADLHQPRADGVVQRWEELDIGRATLADKTGKTDPGVSSSHLSIAIDANGYLGVKDHDSTNGTQVIAIEDFYTQRHGLDATGQQALGQIVDQLQQNPHMWDSESADRRVLNPYQ